MASAGDLAASDLTSFTFQPYNREVKVGYLKSNFFRCLSLPLSSP